MVEGGVGPSTKLPSTMLRVKLTTSQVAGEPVSPEAFTVALRAMEDKTQVKGHDPGEGIKELWVYLKACSHGLSSPWRICQARSSILAG